MASEYVSGLFSVEGKVVVVTGGGGILCGAMSRALARAGARIALLNIRRPSAERVAQQIWGAGGEAMIVQADVMDRAALQRTSDEVLAHYGRVDALINGAGGNKPEGTVTEDTNFFDLDEAAFRAVLDLNFIGTVLPSQVYGAVMARQGEGAIINIASVNALRPLTKIPAYSAAKAAVKNLTEWLATYMAQEHGHNIRVNGIAPGFFLTDQNRYLLTDEVTGELTARAQTIIDHTPMGRFGDPEELVGTVIWLLSPAASFVHGATIIVDGGFCAFGGV